MRAVVTRQVGAAFRRCQLQYRTFAAAAPAASEPRPIQVQHYPAPHSGTIRVLLLDRPEARNALSRKLVTELRRHVEEIQRESGKGPTRALILASNADKAFCAGADLTERKGMSQEEWVNLSSRGGHS